MCVNGNPASNSHAPTQTDTVTHTHTRVRAHTHTHTHAEFFLLPSFTTYLFFLAAYYSSGVLLLQSLVGKALIREWTGVNTSFNLSLQRMPYPPYVSDPMVTILQTQLPLFLILSFILSVIQSTKNIVYEKERKLKVGG